MIKKEFDVYGMTCGACQSHVQRAVEKLSGTKNVNVNLLQNSMVVEFDESVCSVDKILSSVKNAGYGASLKGEIKTNDKSVTNEKNKINELKKLVFSFIFLILLMYFSMGNMMWNWYAPPCFDHKSNPVGFALIQFLLLIPIVIINKRYFESGLKKLFKGKPNMDSLIAVGAGISIIYGIFSLFMISLSQARIADMVTGTIGDFEYYTSKIMSYHDSIYFESAGMILTLVSLGKYLENLSKKKTTKAVEKLTSLAPKTATLLRDNNEIIIDIKDVKVNDIIIVKRGQAVPIDGEIINGTASINESTITGESLPVQKTFGDSVYSSSIVENGYIQIKALKVGEDTSIARVIKLVEEASNSKAPISKLADKISGIFVPIIFAISLITFICNLIASHSFELSLNFAITVIVIACPCALGLATPVSIMVGTGKGAENGLIIKNAEILEKAQFIKTIVLDKTGTITEGKPSVTDFIEIEKIEDLVSIIYSIEKKSEHPLAKSITEFGIANNAKDVEISNFEAIDGLGLKADYNGSLYYIGNYNFAKELKIESKEVKTKVDEFISEAKIPLIIIKDKTVVAIIAIKDRIQENSKLAIKLLKKSGIKVIMLTGDNKQTANIVAKQVGVDRVFAEVKPEDKQRIIKELKTDDKHLVAMVGDGVNDALALSSADLGVSIGAGSEIAIETSDIVLIRNDLLDVLNIINLSKKVLKTIKLGLFWAFFYNFVCVMISTGIFYYPFGFSINPMIGSLAMSLSSVSVVLNALTINFFKPAKLENGNKENQRARIDKEELDKESIDKLEIDTKENDNKNNDIMEVKQMEFYVKGMMCHNCENHIRKALEESGEGDIQINLETKQVKISTTKSQEEIFEIIKNAGYDATLE